MNSLVLIPGKTGVRYWRGSIGSVAEVEGGPAFGGGLCGITASVGDLGAVLAVNHDDRPIDVLTIRAVYGGLDFSAPIIVDDRMQARLLQLGAQSPLSVANTTAVVDDARATFPDTPIALAFETSFFVGLPARETTYALPSGIGQSVRRWGYHGLFHDAASAEFAQVLGPRGRPARILSVCLDASPEIAAVLGRTPLVVTSGNTPVEGLPGEFNCGEIDPAIALALAADPEIGPERANLMLTRESGYFGMLGWPATLGEVLTEKRARVAQAREHLLYHMSLAAGTGLAALEGLDGVVFSGRYAEHGDKVAAHLLPSIERTLDMPVGTLPWYICRTPLEAILAEAGATAMFARGRARERMAREGMEQLV
jgi:acetate kinase